MTFSQLQDLVYAIEYDPRRSSVFFGCDCGCGGDDYTPDEFDEACEAADAAAETLIAMGVDFNDDV